MAKDKVLMDNDSKLITDLKKLISRLRGKNDQLSKDIEVKDSELQILSKYLNEDKGIQLDKIKEVTESQSQQV